MQQHQDTSDGTSEKFRRWSEQRDAELARNTEAIRAAARKASRDELIVERRSVPSADERYWQPHKEYWCAHHHERGQLSSARARQDRHRVGRWAFRLESNETDEWDANEAAKLFIGKLTADPVVWNTIASRATVRLTIALFLEKAN